MSPETMNCVSLPSTTSWITSLVLVFLTCLGCTLPSQALNVTVNNDSDSGAGSLRQAIADAIASGDPTNRIQFAGSLDGQTITLTTGQIAINSANDFEIDASSLPNKVKISGNFNDRILDLEGSGSFSLKNIIFTAGLAPDGSGGVGEEGGAIRAIDDVNLTIMSCDFETNGAGDGDAGFSGGDGGGLYFRGNHFQAESCTFRQNFAGDGGIASGGSTGRGGNGGGIAISDIIGSATLLNCEFVLNEGGISPDASGADDSNSGGSGGGIYISTQDSVTLERCTFTGNSGGDGGDAVNGAAGFGGSGGAIFISQHNSAGSLITILDCSIGQNTTGNPGSSSFGTNFSGGSGGGVYISGGNVLLANNLVLFNQTGTGGAGGASGGGIAITPSNINPNVDIFNTTIVVNVAEDKGGGIYCTAGTTNVIHCTIIQNNGSNKGGGVLASDVGGLGSTVNVENSVVTLNAATSIAQIGSEGLGALAEQGFNFTTGDPMVNTLANNGGFSDSLKPMPGSPLIDAGVPSLSIPIIDQRGFDRIFGSAPDVGAVELTYLTDNRIGKKKNPATHKIDNVYTPTGAGQVQRVKLKGRKFSKFWTSLEIDGDTDSILMKGSKVKRTYKMKNFILTGGRTNVTAALKRGLLLIDVPMGSTRQFEHRVKAKRPGPMPKLKYKLTATSQSATFSTDVVKAKVIPGK